MTCVCVCVCVEAGGGEVWIKGVRKLLCNGKRDLLKIKRT